MTPNFAQTLVYVLKKLFGKAYATNAKPPL